MDHAALVAQTQHPAVLAHQQVGRGRRSQQQPDRRDRVAVAQQRPVQAQLALERDYETQREMETRYRVLMEMSPVPLMIVSMSSGKIIDLNTGAAEMIGAPRAELLDAETETALARAWRDHQDTAALHRLIALPKA